MNETLNETAMFLGYTAPITNSPVIDIFLITLVVALFTTMLTKYMTDQTKIKALRKEMKSLQKKMRETMQKDPKKAQAMQQEIMKKNLENMKHAMNPKMMLITILPILLVFSIVSKMYGPLGEFFTFPIFGWQWGWLGTYIFFSIVNSILLKKVLDVA